jgi:hypothetical protein
MFHSPYSYYRMTNSGTIAGCLRNEVMAYIIIIGEEMGNPISELGFFKVVNYARNYLPSCFGTGLIAIAQHRIKIHGYSRFVLPLKIL